MKYIFPRQFGLHNVFTSFVDKSETVQPFKDYTLREQEISQHKRLAILQKGQENIPHQKHHLTKRLRGELVDLIRKLQKLHKKCSYSDILQHYCPVSVLHLICLATEGS